MPPENQFQNQNHEVNPPKKKSSLIWAIVLIVILFGAGTIAGYLALNTERPVQVIEPQIEFEETTFDTSDWQTYRNEEFGFEFKYPISWITIKEEKIIPKDYEPYFFILEVELVDKNSGESKLTARLLPTEWAQVFTDSYHKMGYFNGAKIDERLIDGFKTVTFNHGCYECYYVDEEGDVSYNEWIQKTKKIRNQPISLTCNNSGVCLQIHVTESVIKDEDPRIFFMENFLPTLKFNKENFDSIEYEFQEGRG